MDLFSIGREGDRDSRSLADRMRPSSLDEYMGQEHIIGPGKLLRRAIEATKSLPFYCTARREAKQRLRILSHSKRRGTSFG